MLGGGLSGGLWALEELFGLSVEEEIYGDVWTLSLALLAPWLARIVVPLVNCWLLDVVNSSMY